MLLLIEWIATIIFTVIVSGLIAPNLVNAHNTIMLVMALICWGANIVVLGLIIKRTIPHIAEYLEKF